MNKDNVVLTRTPHNPSLRFDSFLSNSAWEEYELQDISDIKRGNGLNKASVVEGGVNSCILYGELFTKYNTVITKVISSTNDIATMRSKKGDILMPTSDVTPKGLAKASAIMVDDVILGSDMNVIRVNKEIVDPVFISYAINHFPKKIIDKVSGSTVKHIYAKDLRDIKYYFPSLPEQKKIAEFFSALDERITLQAEKVALLKEHKKGVQQKIFNRELVFTDDNGDAYPEWEEKKLGEVANVVGGGTPSTGNSKFWDGDINWFSPTEVGKNKYLHESERKITQDGLKASSAKIHPAGTVLLTTRASLGRMGILQKEASTNQGFQSLLPKEVTISEFLYYLQPQIERYCDVKASGSTFREISGKEISKMPLLLPSLPEQEKITELLSALDKQIELNEDKLELLKEQKNGYLQGIFG